MISISEEEFREALTPTYYTGHEYLDIDGIERSVRMDFGLDSHKVQQAITEVFKRLKGRRGSAFYRELEASLRGADSNAVRGCLRVLLFLSSIPAGEDFLPLVTGAGTMSKFDLRPLKRTDSSLTSERVTSYVSLLRELRVDRLVGRADFDLFPVLMAAKVGSEGNLRKGRSGRLMAERCDQELRRFVAVNRDRWLEIQYLSEREEQISIAKGLRPDKVGEWLDSIEDAASRSETARDIEKVVDGLLTVRDPRGTLQVFCEFNGYFSSGGSKPSEIRRAYRYLSGYVPRGAAFLWVTDGRLFLNAEMNALNSLGRDLVAFNGRRPWAVVMTPSLLAKHLSTFIEQNFGRIEQD